jgi:hypothetical protein
LAGGVSWLRSGFDNAFKEKQNPAIPIAGLADALEEFVVPLPVSLEIEAEIKLWLLELAASQSWKVMSRRPRRPVPSKKGWIVSNWTCARAALIRRGIP